MAKNDKVLLDGILDERTKQKIPSENISEVFEYLTYEQVLKEYDFSFEEIEQGEVDGENDGGIDAIYIIINGHLAENLDKEHLPKSRAELEVYIITCKHSDSFQQSPINNLFTSLQELLDFSKKNDELNGKYNELILAKRGKYIETLKRTAAVLFNHSIKIIYACRGDADNELSDNVIARGEQVETLCRHYFSGCNANFEYWGSKELLEAYRKGAEYSLDLETEDSMTFGKQMVVLVKLSNYNKFITYDDGKIRKYLFDSNVRDFMGLNHVNEDILESLYYPKNDEDFWWLNNGITILCTSASTIGKTITISNIQIVNGLQTSECIYRYYSSIHQDDDRTVLVKILPCDSSEIADDIIRSTNNQTAVQSISLHATDKIQHDIEEVLKKYDMYYDRRANYYVNQGVSLDKIYSPLYLGAGFMSLVLKRPYDAARLKQRTIRKEESYREIFSESENILVWPAIARVLRKTDSYMDSLRNNRNKGERFLKNVRHIVALVTVARLLGTYAFSIEKLVSFDANRYTFDEVKRTWKDISLIAMVSEGHMNWRDKGKNLYVMKEVANIECIDGYGCLLQKAGIGE